MNYILTWLGAIFLVSIVFFIIDSIVFRIKHKSLRWGKESKDL